MPNFPLWPDRASGVATQVDMLFLFALGITVLFSTLIFCTILYLGIKYRRRSPGAVGVALPAHSKATTVLEITWSVIPLLILSLGLFYFVLNGILLWVASWFLPGYRVDGIVAGIVGALVMTLVNWAVHAIRGKKKD